MNQLGDRSPITALLREWRTGDRKALDQLLPIVHEDLRTIAQRRVRALPPNSTMQATALVNEVYLRLVDVGKVDWQDRAHFFALSARLMRQIVIDNARIRGRQKHGGGWLRIPFDEAEIPAAEENDQVLLLLDAALDQLAGLDARKAQVVEMRFFAGMTHGEIAEVMGLSVDTVKRDWGFAKLWLARELKGKPA